MTRSRPLALLALAVVAACGDTQLPDAVFVNSVDTITLGSLTAGPVHVPAAYSIPDDRVVRTDQSSAFDFAYLREDGRRLLVPLAALGLGSRSSNPGLLQSGAAFDALVEPPNDGYRTEDSLAVDVGDVVVARSRIACFLGVPQYAKLQVLSFDDAAATVTLRVVANVNCGYRSLALGIPEE